MFFDVNFVKKALPIILKAIPTTFLVTFVPVLLGCLLGLGIAMARRHRIPVLRQLFTLFVSFMRSTPMFVQLFVFYYGIPRIMSNSPRPSALLIGLLTLTLSCTASLSEVFRGALSAVDSRQMEAARSIGMTGFTAYIRIILPQAAAIALPNMFNFTLGMLKNSSLVFGIGIVDIMAAAKLEAEMGYRFIEGYVIVAALYVIFSIVFSRLFRWLEGISKNRMGGLLDAKTT